MLNSILFGVIAAALVCWAMGAYNRLVRLRVAMAQTFTVWQHMLQTEAEPAESQTPEEIAVQWRKIEAERMLCKEAYEAAVAQYNQAIAQAPAAWLAALFSFKPVRSDEGKH